VKRHVYSNTSIPSLHKTTIRLSIDMDGHIKSENHKEGQQIASRSLCEVNVPAKTRLKHLLNKVSRLIECSGILWRIFMHLKSKRATCSHEYRRFDRDVKMELLI
jgi:hypothetical protein